jgi:hypothetical protein
MLNIAAAFPLLVLSNYLHHHQASCEEIRSFLDLFAYQGMTSY